MHWSDLIFIKERQFVKSQAALVISLVTSFQTAFGFWAEKSTIMTEHWKWAVNRLVGWRDGVKVGAKSKLNNYASFILLLNFPPFTLVSVYIKKKLVGASSHKWGQLGRIGKWFIDIVPIWWSWWHQREELMRMTKVYQNAWKSKETASMTIMLIIRLEGQRWRNPWWDYQKVSESGTALPLVAPSVAPLQCTGGQIGAFAANGANYVDNENEHDDELFPS